MSEPPAGDADGSFSDTTIRRPRVPTPPTEQAPDTVDETHGTIDETHDTVIVRRDAGSRAIGLSGSTPATPEELDEPVAGAGAYASRAAAPVRASRKAPSPREVVDPTVPDASAIRRALRAQARRRLAGLTVAVVGLIVVLIAVLVILVFAVGV